MNVLKVILMDNKSYLFYLREPQSFFSPLYIYIKREHKKPVPLPLICLYYVSTYTSLPCILSYTAHLCKIIYFPFTFKLVYTMTTQSLIQPRNIHFILNSFYTCLCALKYTLAVVAQKERLSKLLSAC